MRHLTSVIAATATALGAIGCVQAEFGSLRVEQRSFSPLPVEVDDDGISLPLGIAVSVKVKPVSQSRQKYTANDKLELVSDNPSVMDAFQLDETSTVVLTGVRLGNTCLRVVVNHNEVDCLDITVTEQPAEPQGDQ